MIDIAHLIYELRQQLPASVTMCREAIIAADLDLSLAHDIIVHKLINDVVIRTGTSYDDASAKLIAAQFDVERAIELWKRDNPPPEPSPREKLLKGVDLAAAIRVPAAEMRRYVHIIPLTDDRYELRIITHHEQFTETDYALDYDYALQDSRTRIKRLFTEGVDSTFEQLVAWSITEEMLQAPDTFDSCLLDDIINGYLTPDCIPHLWIDD